MNGVRAERLGWRDEKISRRHREWGVQCPCVDIDFLLVEHSFGKPAALIEYKFHLATLNFSHANYMALGALADSAGIPFIIALYWPDSWSFKIHPMNDLAKLYFEDGQILSEEEYVKKLHHLRRVSMNQELIGKLNTFVPYMVK